MASTERITTTEAAERKGCTRQNVNYAIRAGKIDTEQIGRAYIVFVNRKFEDWTLNLNIQAAARRKKPKRRTKKTKKR